jgi:hypothetical protein
VLFCYNDGSRLCWLKGGNRAGLRHGVCGSFDSSMDIFADALTDALMYGDSTPPPPPKAPSQELSLDFEVEDAVAIDLLSDDEDQLVAGTIGDPASADALGNSMVAPSVDCKSIVAVRPPPCKRRRVQEKGPKLIEVSSGDPCEIVCIFVDNGKIRVPVPLWSQYTVTWIGADVEASRWIMVGNYERWVCSLVDVVTNSSVRRVAKSFLDRVRKEFVACLETARRPEALGDAFLGAESGDSSTVALGAAIATRRQSNGIRILHRAEKPSLVLNIGGFHVMCLNDAKKMVMRLNDETIKFIVGWVVPLLRETARSQDLEVTEAAEAPRKLAQFHFIAPTTPNIRDKVIWNPTKHCFEILLAKNKRSPSEKCDVDPSLDRQSYDEAKATAYRRAIETWNKLDGSSRHRIPTHS